ncbi:AsmA family protein [Tianweitania sp. BSSL-BM11]|uniref:AsmA family protein n=1 Tax=Tianweitania aestuarii TaxID=2814886 RepID=A0ABS5RQW4_9HYPH|nr:AsmA-like C-terminal region-containing protein [Tianweitania aestuarii]MBS9719438.1 AsmA family protein [Tianweitania aestuarii]
MPRPTLRKTLWTVLVIAVIAGAVVLALPFAASNHLVRDRIAQELGAWSGMRVEAGSRPEIEVWPTLRAVLHDVRFTDWDADGAPVLQAERIEMEMSAWHVLRGDITFDQLRLVRPVLRVAPVAPGIYLPPTPRGGRLARAIEAARQTLNANPTAPDLSKLPDNDLGTIDFVDASVLTQEAGAEREIASGLNGSLNWPSLNRGGSLRAQGLWRGETVSLELASGQPLLHLAGGTTVLRASLRSPPLNASFDGTAGLSADALITGILQFSTPSASGAANWLQVELASGMAPGAVEFSGQLSGSAERLKFSSASVVLEGNTGIGGFDVSFEDEVPAISGTFAFDVLDLPTMLGVFSPLLPQMEAGRTEPSAAINRMKLDLRLSASTARAGPVSLSEIAATAQVRPGLAVLDISDSTAFGGTLQAGIRASREPGKEVVDLSLLASGFDGTAAGDALGLQALLPASLGTLSLTLKGTGETWERVLQTADGTFSAGFARGTLRRFNLDQFLQRLNNSGFFALQDVSSGTLAIEGAQLKATMDDGMAQITQATVDTTNRRILIEGFVPYVGGLALSGDVRPSPPLSSTTSEPPPQDEPQQMPLASFFVGGSWNAPFISSMTMRAPLQ